MKKDIEPYLMTAVLFSLDKLKKEELSIDDLDGIIFRDKFLSAEEYQKTPKITGRALFEKLVFDFESELPEKIIQEVIRTFHQLPFFFDESDEMEKEKRIFEILFTTDHFRKP